MKNETTKTKKNEKKKGSIIMWKLLLVFGMPLAYPFLIAYGIIMNIFGPLGLPDIFGLMTNM